MGPSGAAGLLQAEKIGPISGSWNMKSVRFTTPTKLASWTWLYLDLGGRPHFSSPRELGETVQAFVAKLNEIGVAAAPSTPGQDNKNSYLEDIIIVYRSVTEAR